MMEDAIFVSVVGVIAIAVLWIMFSPNPPQDRA